MDEPPHDAHRRIYKEAGLLKIKSAYTYHQHKFFSTSHRLYKRPQEFSSTITMQLSIILPTLFAALAIAMPSPAPAPQPNQGLRARFYDELAKRHCPGGNNDNICGEGYFYVSYYTPS